MWTAHTHCFQAFDLTPRLNIRSPEKGCGKTTLSDVIALFVPRSIQTENQTPAVLFRLIEKHKPVVLADEYDAWLRDNEELRGLLNAGHRRGGKALRCEGDNHEVRGFNVFAPAVLSGIGALPGTLHDRSIGIVLTRAKPGEVAARFSSRHVTAEKDICRKLARWTADNFQKIEACDPQLPDGAHNRLADNWRPLFAIADGIGWSAPRRWLGSPRFRRLWIDLRESWRFRCKSLHVPQQGECGRAGSPYRYPPISICPWRCRAFLRLFQ